MPRIAGIYSKPYPDVTPGTPIESTVFNGTVADLEQDLNTPRPIVAGGTGANNAQDAIINLHGELSGQNVDNYDTFPFADGSFTSQPGATGAPSPGYLAGIAYGLPLNAVVLELVDLTAAGCPRYNRYKVSGVWSPWVGPLAGAAGDYVAKIGDTMTGPLNAPKFNVAGNDPNGYYINAKLVITHNNDTTYPGVYLNDGAGGNRIAFGDINSIDPATYYIANSQHVWYLGGTLADPWGGTVGATLNADELNLPKSLNINGSTSTAAPTRLTIGTDTATENAIFLQGYGSNIYGPYLIFQKTRGATPTSNGIVQNNDNVGFLDFTANDGTGFADIANITADMDGVPAVGLLPGRLSFWTTATTTAIERMRIDHTGKVSVLATTVSTSPATGALTVAGGVGIGGDVGIGGGVGIGGAANIGTYAAIGGPQFGPFALSIYNSAPQGLMTIYTGAPSPVGAAVFNSTTVTAPNAADQRLMGMMGGAISSPGASSNSVGVAGFSSQAWTAGSVQGSYLDLQTTPNGTAARATGLRVQPSGGVSIGASALAVDPGAGNLTVVGEFKTNGNIVRFNSAGSSYIWLAGGAFNVTDPIIVAGNPVLTTAGQQLITAGFRFTPYNGSTVSSGTYTPDAYNHNYQYYTNNGAHTIAAPANDCAIDILITNGASAGAIAFSGYAGGLTGDPLTTTNGSKFLVSIRRINATSIYSVRALQ